MSNALAVAAVTATLQHSLDGALSNAALAFPHGLQGAKVFVGHPTTTHAGATAGADLFLYRVGLDPSFRNVDLPTRDADGQTVQRPVAGLLLRYLVSCFGDEANQEPEQVLGTIASYLHAFPTITKAMIDDAASSGRFPFMQDADLRAQLRPVRLTQVPIDDEDLFRIWSTLPSDELVPTLVYDAVVVLVEEPVTAREALPVLDRGGTVKPSAPPSVTAVRLPASPSLPPRPGPIRPGDDIEILGTNLGVGDWELRLDGTPVAPTVQVARGDLIDLTLPLSTRAGARALQVAHFLGQGEPPGNTPFLAVSEPYVIAVHPDIQPPTAAAGAISITATMPIDRSQDIQVVLNRVGSDASVVLPGTLTPPGTAPTTTVRADATAVAPGQWVVRLRVDGVTSIPTVGGSGVVDQPSVTL